MRNPNDTPRVLNILREASTPELFLKKALRIVIPYDHILFASKGVRSVYKLLRYEVYMGKSSDTPLFLGYLGFPKLESREPIATPPYPKEVALRKAFNKAYLQAAEARKLWHLIPPRMRRSSYVDSETGEKTTFSGDDLDLYVALRLQDLPRLLMTPVVSTLIRRVIQAQGIQLWVLKSIAKKIFEPDFRVWVDIYPDPKVKGRFIASYTKKGEAYWSFITFEIAFDLKPDGLYITIHRVVFSRSKSKESISVPINDGPRGPFPIDESGRVNVDDATIQTLREKIRYLEVAYGYFLDAFESELKNRGFNHLSQSVVDSVYELDGAGVVAADPNGYLGPLYIYAYDPDKLPNLVEAIKNIHHPDISRVSVKIVEPDRKTRGLVNKSDQLVRAFFIPKKLTDVEAFGKVVAQEVAKAMTQALT